jgi:hypothetical protein
MRALPYTMAFLVATALLLFAAAKLTLIARRGWLRHQLRNETRAREATAWTAYATPAGDFWEVGVHRYYQTEAGGQSLERRVLKTGVPQLDVDTEYALAEDTAQHYNNHHVRDVNCGGHNG